MLHETAMACAKCAMCRCAARDLGLQAVKSLGARVKMYSDKALEQNEYYLFLFVYMFLFLSLCF